MRTSLPQLPLVSRARLLSTIDQPHRPLHTTYGADDGVGRTHEWRCREAGWLRRAAGHRRRCLSPRRCASCWSAHLRSTRAATSRTGSWAPTACAATCGVTHSPGGQIVPAATSGGGSRSALRFLSARTTARPASAASSTSTTTAASSDGASPARVSQATWASSS